MKHITLRTHEVQNIIAGRQTRLSRPVKPQPEAIRGHHIAGYSNNPDVPWPADYGFGVLFSSAQYGLTEAVKCSFGKVGDIIACKETFTVLEPEHCASMAERFVYKASCNALDDGYRLGYIVQGYPYQWKPSTQMPLSACRLFLRVKEIRCERIQDITEEGAKAEGVEEMTHRCGGFGYYEAGGEVKDCICQQWEHPPVIMAYREQHQSIYGPDSWERNDWHWILIVEKTDNP